MFVMDREQDKKKKKIEINAKPIAASIFISITGVLIDVLTPLGVASDIIYISLVMCGLWFKYKYSTFILAAIGSLLSFSGFINAAKHEEIWIALTNMLLSVAALWIVAALLHTRKKKEMEAIEARDEAEMAHKLKTEFLANMSHEIRTPLNGVIGMAQLLQESSLNVEQKEKADHIVKSADMLLEILNDILDLSKIESDKLNLENISFDLQLLMEDVATLLAEKAQEKGIELLLGYPPDTPRYVVGDPGRVRQVLNNLIYNALKFTDEGHIMIDVNGKNMEDGRIEFYVRIEDTGIGIPEDKQEYIFNKFNQADQSTTRKFGGTGLGLAICKKLTDMMDGDVGVVSTYGEGSTFWFTMRLSPDTNKRVAKEHEKTDFSGMKALIIDDSRTSCLVLKEQLRGLNIDTRFTLSVKKALNMIHHAQEAGEAFDLLLIDYLMPGMNGEELGQLIKMDNKLKDITMIMVTATPYKGQGKRLSEIGFSGYLIKPIQPSAIAEMIEQMCWAKKEGKELPLLTKHTLKEEDIHAHNEQMKGLRLDDINILVAEDNPVNQIIIDKMLERFGCNITLSENGRKAVEATEEKFFDIIFMDCNMPEMDGFEATSFIREGQKNSNEKSFIIALTANAMKGDKEQCLEAGMDDYLSKPLKEDKLLDALSRWKSSTKKADEIPLSSSAA